MIPYNFHSYEMRGKSVPELRMLGVRDNLIRDRINCSVSKLRERLLREPGLTLPDAIRIVQTYDEAEKQTKLIAAGNTVKKLHGNFDGTEKKSGARQAEGSLPGKCYECGERFECEKR